MKWLHLGLKQPTASSQSLKICPKHLWFFIMSLFSSWKRTSKEIRCLHSFVQVNLNLVNVDSEFGILIVLQFSVHERLTLHCILHS